MSTQNTTTLFDLYQTAQAAAVKVLGKDQLSVESNKLEEFATAGHDRADYPQWSSFYDGATGLLTNYKNQPSTSAKLAAAAAATLAANKTQAAQAGPGPTTAP